jgi:diaminopimelate decarboxylase
MKAETDLPMSVAERVVADNFAVLDGTLLIDGVSVREVADCVGTPCYVYGSGVIRRSLASLRDAVGEFAEIYFSIKANPNPRVASIFVEEGAGLEIASGAEYVRARKAGCAPEKILFAGPGKQDEELRFVLHRGIGEIHVESFGEIDRLSRIAESLGRRAKVAVRVNPVATGQGGAMVMGGRPTQFGIDEECLAEAVDRIEATSALRLTGIHLFAGTQILDVGVLERQWAHCLGLASAIAKRLGRPLETIDLGGGLGIPYFEGDLPLDLDDLRGVARNLALRKASDPHIAPSRVILEPGRYLVGPAGIYLTSVVDIKTSRGARFVVLDGGLHQHLAATGNLGQIVKRDYPLVPAERMDDDDLIDAQVVGPLCTPLDTLGRRTPMPKLAVGDLLAVLQSGAYGLTASPVGFLSHPMAPEVLIENDVMHVVRPRGTFDQPISALP